MAVGFEKMAAGSLEKLQPIMEDRALSVDKHINVMSETYGLTPSPITCQVSLFMTESCTLTENCVLL